MKASISSQEANLVDEHLRTVIHDCHARECITLHFFLGYPQTLFHDICQSILGETIVKEASRMHEIPLMTKLCLRSACLCKSIHTEEIGDFLFIIFNHIGPHHVVLREKEVDDIILRHLVKNFVLRLLLLIQFEHSLDVFLLHFTNVANDVDCLFFRNLMSFFELFHCKVWRFVCIFDLNKLL